MTQFFVLNHRKEENYMKTGIIKSLVLLVLVVMFAFVSILEAADKSIKPKPIKLKGTYAVQGQDVCVGRWTYNPFNQDPPGPYWPSTVWTKTANIQGIVTYDGDGNGVAEETSFTMLHPVYTPIPASPYWGFIFNGGPLPTTSIVSTVPQSINNYPGGWPLNWPEGYPAEPPWPFSAGSITISKATTNLQRTILPDGTVQSSSSGVAHIIFGSLAGKYVKFPTRYFSGHISADHRIIFTSTDVPDAPTYENFWQPLEFYNDQDLTDSFGAQEEICQRIRTLIQIK
jgi:hypothetical protein